MTFTGGPFQDQSDRSSWARSVEGRLGKMIARVATQDIVDRAVTAAKIALASITSSHLATNIPLGTLGYASSTSTQSGITGADLTGITATVTAGTSRRVRVSWFDPNAAGTDVNDDFAFQIKEGATVLQTSVYAIPSANDHNRAANVSVVLTPSAGAHTYKVTVTRTAGVGSIGFTRAADAVGYLLVEDIGGV